MASCIFLDNVFSLDKNKVLANCCVMVEPPCVFPLNIVLKAALKIPPKS